MENVWNSEKIFLDGDEYYNELLKDISSARYYITIEMYIFSDDLLGRKVVEYLIDARKRGVKIQVIVDGIGSYDFFNHLHKKLVENDIKVKMYNPLPFYHPYYGQLNFLRKIQVFFLRLLKINQRNHRKIITIDHKILYTGSFNITAEHTKLHYEPAWKDMGVKVTGDFVRFSILNFKKIWKIRDYFRYKKSIKNLKRINWRNSPVLLNQTIFMKRYLFKNFLNKINSSQQRIWFMTPYFIPKRRLIRLLGRAAERGVDVRIIISLKTDVSIFRTLQYFYYGYLLKKGIKIYQYSDAILHAKNYIIDDWMTIGSTNLNHRSFIHDLEVDMIIQEKNNLKILEDNFNQSIFSSIPITQESLKARPLWDKILSRLFFLFKYWF